MRKTMYIITYNIHRCIFNRYIFNHYTYLIINKYNIRVYFILNNKNRKFIINIYLKEPTQQPPPTIKQINGSAIQVSWTLPDYPNGLKKNLIWKVFNFYLSQGVITYYLLRRNGIILANSVSGSKIYLVYLLLKLN